MMESTYITAVQAISWIAFGDVDAINKRYLVDYLLTNDLQKYKNHGGQIEILPQYKEMLSTIENAKAQLLEVVRAKQTHLWGVQKKRNNIHRKISSKYLVQDNSDFSVANNQLVFNRKPFNNSKKLQDWDNLKIRKTDITNIWHRTTSTDKPSIEPTRATSEDIVSEYIRLQSDPLNPRGRLARPILQDKFPSAQYKDIDNAIKIGNQQLKRGRGAPKKLAKK
jgi:hypothetical protein